MPTDVKNAMGEIVKSVKACAEGTGWSPPSGRLGLVLSSWFPSASPDADGPLKRTLDALQSALGINDNRVDVILVFKDVDPDNPRMEIQVWGLDTNEPAHQGRDVTEGSEWVLYPG